jgi:hypothetical protein
MRRCSNTNYIGERLSLGGKTPAVSAVKPSRDRSIRKAWSSSPIVVVNERQDFGLQVLCGVRNLRTEIGNSISLASGMKVPSNYVRMYRTYSMTSHKSL